ncbi:probable UDP-N-acetylglucosamine--peptide N-acetylglucosaminyltransferase SEC [Cynara cardunculus var. scolymus]|uniref:probable UDP-N-acetylglucosamine--peptide N-acetylglucosaminyltransferase SEC n=1 Tax=Cynara cardunculus var. scolymus TaxID=59895 RepID=UPI000D6284C6|nr:probable UDP-N-acetylglucosamine--peptide N-acetylglucosaminyltransferase SEC [Cynara cardunculus var. scolymus]
MLSLQSDPRQVQQLQQQQQQTARVSYNNGDHQRESSYLLSTETAPTSSNATLKLSQGLESREATEDMLMSVAHQSYKTGDFRQALDHSKAVYDRNPMRLDNLLLLGAIYYQLHDFDMCIAKNEEALCIDRNFAECYGNMANAWKEKGNIDVAIRYYLVAIELRPNFADAWSNLGNAYMRKGRLSEAAQCCRQALSLNPHLVDAHSNLGNLMKAQGLMQEAYSCYLEALHIQPTFAIAWSNLAGLFMESGDLSRALQYYKEAVKLKPTFSDAYLNLGNVYKALGMAAEAIVCYQRALQSKPDYAMAFGNLASIFYEQGSLEMAINHYKQAIACDAGFLEAYNNLGNALKDAGKVEEAIHCYRQCLSLQPSHPQALTNLGNIYMEWNMMTAAVQCYKATLSVTTGLSAPFNNLAIIYKQQGNYADAISCYNEVLRIDPLAADGLVNRGNTYKEIGRVNEAVQDYSRAIVIRPNMAEAHANLASAYKDSGNVEAAIKSYRQALAIRPDFPEATCNLLHTLQCVCDWDDRTRMFVEVDGVLRRQIKTSVIPSVQPFHAIAYPLDPVLALEISRKYASHCSVIASRFSLPAFNHPLPLPIKVSGGNKRLKIGYVSSDFGNHPLSHLMGSVFGMHNRENIEVFCYALSPNDGSEWRIRIQSEAEHFKDVSAMTSDMIARLINEDQIQILVNLNGYTKGARNEIFAMQPAPIQVSYMGFPGTTGANYIQYLVTDEFVSPFKLVHIYSEKLVHLPHCYFVNDYKQKNLDVLDPNCQPKRSAYGLPDDKFIFACFNQLYKMDPEIFMHWCNILKRVPNSALWLLRFPAAGEMRLRAYAAAQGVKSDQIIFTDVAMKNEHIRRSSLADLCLDTPLCNAHTTGTDVLWAGLPMVTLPLEKMATRVAGSLCLATGVGEEMIANSMKEYEERAVSLALNPSKLQDLTKRLKSARLTCPLFDTSRWVTNLERSYMKMWNLHCDGRQPHHFKVKENDSDYPYDR